MKKLPVGTLLLVAFFGCALWILSLTFSAPSSQTAQSLDTLSPILNATEQPTNTIVIVQPSATVEPALVQPAITLLPTELIVRQQYLSLPLEEQATAYALNCTTNPLTAPLTQDICSEMKANVLGLEEYFFYQTATASVPTPDPNRTATPFPPLPTPTPYILTDADRIIQEIPQGFPGGPEPDSVWSLGTVVGPRGEPYFIYLWSDVFMRDNELRSVLVLEYLSSPDGLIERDPAFNERLWVLPQNIGIFRITSVSERKGLVTFASKDGLWSGTFDLTTEEWSFLPVAATVTVMPGSP